MTAWPPYGHVSLIGSLPTAGGWWFLIFLLVPPGALRRMIPNDHNFSRGLRPPTMLRHTTGSGMEGFIKIVSLRLAAPSKHIPHFGTVQASMHKLQCTYNSACRDHIRKQGFLSMNVSIPVESTVPLHYIISCKVLSQAQLGTGDAGAGRPTWQGDLGVWELPGLASRWSRWRSNRCGPLQCGSGSLCAISGPKSARLRFVMGFMWFEFMILETCQLATKRIKTLFSHIA